MLPYFRFHHVGVAVFDIEATSKFYIDAGYSKTITIYDPHQNVYICFLTKEGMPMVELLAPRGQTSPVTRTLERSGVTPYHICYEVGDLNQAISDLRKLKFIPLKKTIEACALEGRKICFFFNKNVGLIELLETKK